MTSKAQTEPRSPDVFTLTRGWHPVLVPNGVVTVSWSADYSVAVGPLDGTMAVKSGRTGKGIVDESGMIGIRANDVTCIRLTWE